MEIHLRLYAPFFKKMKLAWQFFRKKSCTKFHKNPTKGLVAGLSHTHLHIYARTDCCGLHIRISLYTPQEIALLVQRLAKGWTVRGSNPSGGEIFRTRPDRPWGPRSLLYMGTGSLSRGYNGRGRGVDHLPPSSAKVKERVELYRYSPSGPSRVTF